MPSPLEGAIKAGFSTFSVLPAATTDSRSALANGEFDEIIFSLGKFQKRNNPFKA